MPADEIVKVRSNMPGNVEIGTCGSVEEHVLVHLVGHHDQVVLDRDVGDRLQLRRVNTEPGRIVRRIEQNQSGARCDRRPQPVDVQSEIGRTQA